MKIVAKKGRGRNYRSKMRCKTCGCAECVARRPPKDTNCDAEATIQKEWLSLNGDKLPARPSRSKAKSCLRCAKNCWRIGPETRKKVGEATGVSRTAHCEYSYCPIIVTRLILFAGCVLSSSATQDSTVRPSLQDLRMRRMRRPLQWDLQCHAR